MIARPLRIWKLTQNALYNCLRQVRYTQAMNIWLATTIYIMNSFFSTLSIYLRILCCLPQGVLQNSVSHPEPTEATGSQWGLHCLALLFKIRYMPCSSCLFYDLYFHCFHVRVFLSFSECDLYSLINNKTLFFFSF